MEKSIIIDETLKNIKRFNTVGRTIRFKMVDLPTVESDPIQCFKMGIKEIIDYGIKGLNPDDQVGMTFMDCSNFKNGQGWIKFKRASEII